MEAGGLKLSHDFGESQLPRVEGPHVALHGRLQKVEEIGNQKQGLCFVQLEQLWLADSVVSSKGDQDGTGLILDASKIGPLGRLGGDDYALFGEVKTVNRPPYTP